MRGDAFGFEPAFGIPEVESRPWRAGRTLFAFCRQAWISLLLATVILIPWPPWYQSVPAMKPSRRAPGTSSFPIVGLAFGADAQTLGTTDESGRATLWRVAEGWVPQQTLAYRGHAKVVALSSDGRYFAVGGDAPHVAMWDLGRDNREHALQIPVRSTSNLKFSPDGRTLAATANDGDIRFWDVNDLIANWHDD
jgi:WD40 repeat protein